MIVFGRPPTPWWTPHLQKHGVVLTTSLEESRLAVSAPPLPFFVPIDYGDVAFANDHAARFQGQLFAPSTEIVRTFDNPLSFYEWIEDRGLDSLVPARLDRGLRYPCVLKRARAGTGFSAGEGVHLLRSEDDTRAFLSDHGGEPYLAQEFIDGGESYVAHAVSRAGVIVKMLVFRVELPEGDPIKRGALPSSRVDVRPEDWLAIKGILATARYTGFSCTNFKRGAAGEPRIFEVNPRMGASLVLDNDAMSEMLAAVLERLP